jgi:methionyl-tRNA synthetase
MELQVLQFVRSERCRKILRALVSESNDFAFRREDIVKRLGNEERRVLDNFLQRMHRLGVLVADKGRGACRFRDLLHFFYFAVEARRRAQR